NGRLTWEYLVVGWAPSLRSYGYTVNKRVLLIGGRLIKRIRWSAGPSDGGCAPELMTIDKAAARRNVRLVPRPCLCSNIIDTTNKLLMNRLKIKRDYTWDPVTNEATKYIDELIDNSDTRDKFRCKLQLSFVPPNKIYSFSKH
ncbi:3388_t:CDS:2, partial [Acaulospora morrowiae]